MFNKKFSIFIFALILALLFSSCSTTREDEDQVAISDEEAIEALSTLYIDSLDLAKELYRVNSDELDSLFSFNSMQYRNMLNRFEALYIESRNALDSLLKNASEYAIDNLKDADISITNPLDYLGRSILIRNNSPMILESLRASIGSYIEENSVEFRTSYEAFKFECDVIRLNEENLAFVGYTPTLGEIGSFDTERAINFAASRAYDALIQAETILRNMPLSLQENAIYSLFWEVL